MSTLPISFPQVYLPVYFPLIFWYESEQSLQCIRELFKEHDFGTQAGYNHLINYGHEFPHWKKRSVLLEKDYNTTLEAIWNHTGKRPWDEGISGALQEQYTKDSSINPNGFDMSVNYRETGRFSLDLDTYHLFNKNMFVITVGHTHQGRYNFALQQGGLLALQRYIIVPYYAKFDCSVGLKQLLLFNSRPVKVMFVGGIKNQCESREAAHCFVFRERIYVVDAVEKDYPNDDSFYIQPTPTDETSRSDFRGQHAARGELYRQAQYCLVMPGDGNTAQRLFHAMIQGCIPVFIYHKDSYVVLPFVAYLDWDNLALSYRVSGVEDTRAAIKGKGQNPRFVFFFSNVFLILILFTPQISSPSPPNRGLNCRKRS